MFIRTLLLVGAALLLGCGSLGGRDAGTRGCDGLNCEGCCDGDRCLLGTAAAACGTKGEACAACGEALCVSGRCTFVEPAVKLPYSEGSCEDAPRLALDGGFAVFEGDTRQRVSHSSSSSCGGYDSGDVAVQLDVPVGQRVRVSVTPLDPGFQPILFGRTSCGPGQTPTPGCATAPNEGAPVAYVLDPTTTPTFVYVDGHLQTEGRFRLELTSPGEDCAAPYDAGLPPSVLGRTRGRLNDATGSCGGAGPDTVSIVEVPVRSNLSATMTNVSAGSTPVLYLRKSCGGDEVACARPATAGGTPALVVNDLAPGEYHLWADDDAAGGGEGTLNVSVSPVVAGDNCSVPRTLALEDGGSLVEFLDSAGLVANLAPSCGSPSIRDAVYTFTTSRTLDLSVTSDAFYALALRGTSCGGPELACGQGSLRLAALPPGTYWLWVQHGGFTRRLDIRATPPRTGDACFAPHPLGFTGGGAGGDAFVQATMSGAYHDATSSCGGAGTDEVYAFTTSATLDFRAQASTSNFSPVLQLASACGTGELACSLGSGTGATLERGSLPPGSYWLWVDSLSFGDQYTLSASLTPPVNGDTCLSPYPLPLGLDGGTSASATGSLLQRFDNSFGSCGGQGARDEVYAFSLSATATVTASVSTDAGDYRPVVYLREACATGEHACGASSIAGGSASVTAGLDAGTWYLWVDGLGATAGPYQLEVSAE